MSAVLSIATPVFAVIAIGLYAGRSGIAPASDVAAINRFVFKFAMPAALFGLTAGADPIAGRDLILAGIYGASALTVMLTAYMIGLRLFSLSPPEAGAHAFASTLGNAVFLGLPIALAVEGWFKPFVVLMLVEGIGVIALGAALMDPSKKKGPLGYLAAPFRNPLVIGMAAGLVASFITSATNLNLPGPIATLLTTLGRAAGPAALFSPGLFLATTPRPPIAEVRGKIGAILSLKMIALPALMFAGLSVAGISEPGILGPAMLFSVVPSGVGAFVMASQFGHYEREAAAAVAVTTLLSMISISCVLVIYG